MESRWHICIWGEEPSGRDRDHKSIQIINGCRAPLMVLTMKGTHTSKGAVGTKEMLASGTTLSARGTVGRPQTEVHLDRVLFFMVPMQTMALPRYTAEISVTLVAQLWVPPVAHARTCTNKALLLRWSFTGLCKVYFQQCPPAAAAAAEATGADQE